MSIIRAAITQTTWTGDKESMLAKHEGFAREAAAQGAQLLRVHDVAETVQARNVWRGLSDAALTDFGELPT